MPPQDRRRFNGASGSPSWRDKTASRSSRRREPRSGSRPSVYVYRKLEARGEIRGGRFVAGFAGEQFALPEAVGALREARQRNGDSGVLVSLSGADPLNLAGILTPGPKLAGLTRNRVLYRDGIPIALLESGEIRFLETLEAGSEWEARKTLLRSSVPAPLTHLS